MRHVKAAVAAIAIGLGACTEAPRSNLTDPALKPVNVIVLAACDPAAASAIATSLHNLFDPPQIGEAGNRWSTVVNTCQSNIAQSRENMLQYVQFTIDKLALGQVKPQATGTPADAVLAHWNDIFQFVGYLAPNLTPAIFGPEGAARVITQTTVNRELAAANAAMTIPVQGAGGDQRGHLFVVYPIPTGCLTGSNLEQSGPCFEFAAFPTVSPIFDPKVKVGICQPLDDENDELPQGAPALGHLTAGFVRIPSQTQYPTFCEHGDEFADAGSWRGGFGGITKRLAYFARKAVGVQPLYAVHGGLGGLGGGLSPFGAVDLMVFQASLSGQTLGDPPSAAAGTWSSHVTAPGSVAVQASLAGYPDTVIVLSQGNGPCLNCAHLKFLANLFAASGSGGATLGVYDVSWVSLQNKNGATNAPFVIRGTHNREIAKLAYVTASGHKLLRYNGANVGLWQLGQPQRFRIRVNLDTKKTTLFINDVAVASNKNFTKPAPDLATFGAEFSLLDSGIIGWAEISIVRLPDE